MDMRSDLRSALSNLDAISSSELVSLANTVTESGSAHARFTQMLSSALTAVSEIRNTYLKYDAHVVNTVSKLLEYLRQEKLTLFQELLLTAKFSQIPDIDPERVSTKGDVEGMLSAAVDLFGDQTGFVDVVRGFDTLSDYFIRGEEPNLEIRELPETDFTI